jgi:hypothetical protein
LALTILQLVYQGGAKLERARDLFEQALEKCPEKFCKPLFLMYAQLEEEHGLSKRAMGIYDRAATAVQDSDKMEVSEDIIGSTDVTSSYVFVFARCSRYTSPRLRPTSVFLPPDRSTNELLKYCPIGRLLTCACDSPHSRGNWERSTEQELSTLMLRNSAILELTPNSGRSGIHSRVRLCD